MLQYGKPKGSLLKIYIKITFAIFINVVVGRYTPIICLILRLIHIELYYYGYSSARLFIEIRITAMINYLIMDQLNHTAQMCNLADH